MAMVSPEIKIYPEYIPPAAATELYDRLCAPIDWDERMSARKTACYGFSYDYSGVSYEDKPMHSLLLPICDRLLATLGFMPTSCLINFYPDGRSKMGFHSDEVANLAPDTGIAVISLGAERNLSFRSTRDYNVRSSVLLPHGSLLYMSLATQTDWSHAIKRTNIHDGRISLTFRQIVK
jgi:alkylated DNA repair dioxygenase AlkB